MAKSIETHNLHGEPLPRITYERIQGGVRGLAFLRPEDMWLGASMLWAENSTVGVPNQVIGTVSRFERPISEGKFESVWLNDAGADLLGKALAKKGFINPGKLIGYLAFEKQHQQDTYFDGGIYLYEYSAAPNEVEVDIRCRYGDISPEKFHEYYAFAEQFGLGNAWSDMQEVGQDAELVVLGEIDRRTSYRMALALQQLLAREQSRP